ncbi:MAG: ABC transporter permease subunit [Treponema sp.]|nr:ABC transporter permease subunit [Treponema sp.]
MIIVYSSMKGGVGKSTDAMITANCLIAFIREIPSELTKAALVDGAGRFYIFRAIVVPLIRSVFAMSKQFIAGLTAGAVKG